MVVAIPIYFLSGGHMVFETKYFDCLLYVALVIRCVRPLGKHSGTVAGVPLCALLSTE